jgi:hypothetical protein
MYVHLKHQHLFSTISCADHLLLENFISDAGWMDWQGMNIM